MHSRVGLSINWIKIVFLIGVIVIILTLLDLIHIINIDSEITLKLVIITLGLLIIIVTIHFILTDRIKKDKIIDVIDNFSELYDHTNLELSHAEKFILDSTLNAVRSHHIKHPDDVPESYEKVIYDRVRKGEITYRRVEVVFNKERLETTIARLVIHEGMNYFIRYYDPPPEPIPVFNALSVDNKGVYLGGYFSYYSDIPVDAKFFVFIRDKEFGSFFNSYWNVLWNNAKPLNDGGQIHWDILRQIAKKVKMTDEEFDAVVKKWSEITSLHKHSN